MIPMTIQFVLLFMYLIIFLSFRECLFPIKIRQGCRNHIGVFPLGLYPSGFLCFSIDSSGLQHHRDRDHDFYFSKSRKDLQTHIWDPGDSILQIENGGIRLWTSHMYGSLLVFVLEIGILVLPPSTTSIILYIGAFILFPLLFISFVIRKTLIIKTRDINHRFDDVIALPQSGEIVAPGYDCLYCVMELWPHQFGFCWIEKWQLLVGLVKYWQQDLIGIGQIWRLRNALPTFKWTPIDTRGSNIWITTAELLVVILKRITESKYCRKTLVRKFWCHCVYTSELDLNTSDLMLRFVKRIFSYKLLNTNRNKEKSNMKLDNNGSFDLLASKATLRKASSNSLLLNFS